jgi:type I restriction enzyme M protein
MKKWDRESWKSDPWGRNIYGTPPQGIADYAFFQHIICSLKKDTGRCAILFPHGILVRDSEMEMRKGIIENDLIDCVIGLGENLFYNSAMEACIVVCRTRKPDERKGKILLVDARCEIREERTQSFLDSNHISRIHNAYESFEDIESFSKVVDIDEVRKKEYSLNIKEYIPDRKYIDQEMEKHSIEYFVEQWKKSSSELKESLESLKELVNNEALG